MKSQSILLPLLFALTTSVLAETAGQRPVSGTGGDAAVTETLPLPFAWARDFWQSLNLQKGTIRLPAAAATLSVPPGFSFLDAADTERVLTEAWGNPPGSGLLGMLLPDGVTPFDAGAWAITIAYEETGHIAVANGVQLDANKLMKRMQRDAALESETRRHEGYESFEVVGWILQPRYDAARHTLSWGRVLRFGSLQDNTLNISIRVLGRKGMLVYELVADEAKRADVESAIPALLAMSTFDPGERYEDFNPESDRLAVIGLEELITSTSP
ncbi:MAG: DUF2167 domain-containing protein [Chromatiales bacterium]|jgi:uncharacterized membrane-anchored protein